MLVNKITAHTVIYFLCETSFYNFKILQKKNTKYKFPVIWLINKIKIVNNEMWNVSNIDWKLNANLAKKKSLVGLIKIESWQLEAGQAKNKPKKPLLTSTSTPTPMSTHCANM